MANLPRIIPEACAKIASLVSSHHVRYGRSKGLKAMKSAYAEKMIIVLEVMLKACTLQFDGALCRVSGGFARSLTVPEIAFFSHLPQRTVERILHDLKDMGFLHSEKQFRRYFSGSLKVAAVWRVFTEKFWKLLNLWSLFVESVKYAAQHAHLQLKHPLKTVGKKIGGIFRKFPPITKEQEQQSKKNNQLFLDMVNCPNRKFAKTCPGGRNPEEICALCRRFTD